MLLSPIIEVTDLFKIYKEQKVMIFDVSNSKNARSNFETEHLEGAHFIDLNTQLADINSDLSKGGRHPLPDLKVFSRTLSELGISKDTHVIIYDDNNGSNASARFWWMLTSVKHEKVQVLNGGFSHAKRNNFPMSSISEPAVPCSEPYPVDEWHLPTISMNDLERISENSSYLVIDVRDKQRFEGSFEPIDLIAGHIPGAVNIPFSENLTRDGLFLNPNLLRDKYEPVLTKSTIDNTIVHCGSGVTACHTLLALTYAGLGTPILYVGSWSEWSRNNKEVIKLAPMD